MPGRIYGRRHEGFAVEKAMQQVQHMRPGRNAGLQRYVDSREDGLFIVVSTGAILLICGTVRDARGFVDFVRNGCGHMSGLLARRSAAGLDEVRGAKGRSIVRTFRALRSQPLSSRDSVPRFINFSCTLPSSAVADLCVFQ